MFFILPEKCGRSLSCDIFLIFFPLFCWVTFYCPLSHCVIVDDKSPFGVCLSVFCWVGVWCCVTGFTVLYCGSLHQLVVGVDGVDVVRYCIHYKTVYKKKRMVSLSLVRCVLKMYF